MIKIYQILSLVLFLSFLLLCFTFFCLAPYKAWAAELEIEYPVLSSGESISSGVEIPQYFKYLFDVGIFTGFFAVFLSLVIAGVLYLISPAQPEAVAAARDRVSGAISGLLILAALYLIVTTINPQLSIFRIGKLEEIPPPPPEPKQAGVYFHNKYFYNEKDDKKECLDEVRPHTTNVADFGLLKNKINAVNIVQNPENKEYYVSVLYDKINFRGKCQYINPNTGCNPVAPFGASASVYQYDFSPNGDGVYFYRISFFNQGGGYYKVKNSEIKGIYIKALEDLQFTDPSRISYPDNPEGCTAPCEMRDCVKYNQKGKCIIGEYCEKKKCPSLAGENISSIKINGNYFVLLIYFSPTDQRFGPWTFCQAFSTLDDINKEGPKQIKWEQIRNNFGVIPNYVAIIPVKQK